MKKQKKIKIQKSFIYQGLGFPVRLKNVPMIHALGTWSPYVDYEALMNIVFWKLAHKESRLTGDEVKFIRLRSKMTLQAFAQSLGVTHPAVIKWEKKGDKATGMHWSNEKDIRMQILVSKVIDAPELLLGLYRSLEQAKRQSNELIEVDLVKEAA